VHTLGILSGWPVGTGFWRLPQSRLPWSLGSRSSSRMANRPPSPSPSVLPLPEIGQRAIAHLVCVRHSHGQAEHSPFGWGFSQGLQRGNPTFAPCPGFFGFFRRTLCPTAVNRLVSPAVGLSGPGFSQPPPFRSACPCPPLGGVRLPLLGKCVQNGRWPRLPFLVHRVVILGFL
jgi:hypothetical protein